MSSAKIFTHSPKCYWVSDQVNRVVHSVFSYFILLPKKCAGIILESSKPLLEGSHNKRKIMEYLNKKIVKKKNQQKEVDLELL